MSRRPASDPSCAEVHEALSARLDGEDEGLAARRVDAHVATCADCRDASQRLAVMARRLRLAEAPPVPELSQRILTALERDGLDGRTTSRRRRGALARAAVALVGVFQIAVSVPLLLALADPGTHLLRHLGALELGLGIGLVFAALQPRRAAGLLPILAVVAVTSLVAAVPDVIAGGVTVIAEVEHVAELVALAGIWWLVRTRPAHPFAPLRAAVDDAT